MQTREFNDERLSGLLRDSSVFGENPHGDLTNTLPAEEFWRLFVEDFSSEENEGDSAPDAKATLQRQLGLTSTELALLSEDAINRLKAGILSHEQNQPELLQTLPTAYEFIFKRADKLSLPLILDMHKAMTAFLSDGTAQDGGKLRSAHACMTTVDKNFTHEGMIELVEEFDAHTAFNINGMFIHKASLEKLIKGESVFSSEEFAQQFPGLFQALLTSTDDRTIIGEVLYKMANTTGIVVQHWTIIDEHDNVNKVLSRQLNQLIEQFNHDISAKALSPAQKMKCIVTLIRRLVRMHPFDHYTLPTLAITLFQHLLVNHLSVLSVLQNPQTFYGHSTEQLLDAVTNGVEHVIAIVNKRQAYSTKGKDTLIVVEKPNALGVPRQIFEPDAEKQDKLRGLSALGKQAHSISMFKLADNAQRKSDSEAESKDKQTSCCACYTLRRR